MEEAYPPPVGTTQRIAPPPISVSEVRWQLAVFLFPLVLGHARLLLRLLDGLNLGLLALALLLIGDLALELLARRLGLVDLRMLVRPYRPGDGLLDLFAQ